MQCGIDEAGRGPVLGPMVISMVCGDQNLLLSMGVRDSQELSPGRREKIYSDIIKSGCSVHSEILTSVEINRLMKIKSLNEIEYDSVLRLVKLANAPVFIDSFDTNERRLSERIFRETGREVVCKHRADSIFPAVMAASIVSKVRRDSIISDLHVRYGDFGSGYPSDPRTINFLRNSVTKGEDISEIVRTEWITYRKLIQENRKNSAYRF